MTGAAPSPAVRLRHNGGVARNVYRIVPSGPGWELHFAGRIVGRWRVKDTALRRAHELASEDQPSLVTLYGKGGVPEREWSYGLDPYPAGG